jgi:hypothetical protein
LCAGAFGLGLAAFAWLAWSGAASAQTNFKPLERGDFTEEEERVTVLKGVEAHVDYALNLHKFDAGDAPHALEESRIDQDLRLSLQTALHRDVQVALVLETFQEPLSDADIRRQPDTDRGRVADGQTLAVNAREAYLQYRFNPNSVITLGRHEVSVADRKGLYFNAIVPALTFDCEVGTWCMPFGAAKVGEGSAEWLYHWALEYRAWDETAGDFHNALRVEVYRIWYSEQDVPLGLNLAPGYAADDPTAPNPALNSDDEGNPIYYDVNLMKGYGLNVVWEQDNLFFDFNFVDSQGLRKYHRARREGGGFDGPLTFEKGEDQDVRRKTLNGWATHLETGWRWSQGRLGLRWLYANGDEDRPGENGSDFLRSLHGYYEVTPGAYQGTRLYFNGTDSRVDGGSGLGHSVTNTRMIGVFLEFDDPETAKVGYHTGLFDLWHFQGVRDTSGEAQRYIGLEFDNMLTWYFHKAAKLQFELNLFKQGAAFSYDDYTPPDRQTDLIVQGLLRFVYSF